jgi:hypothetical protein
MLEIIERAKAIVVTQLFVEPDQVIEAGKNYTVTLNSALGTITPAALTISAVTQTKVYDGIAADADPQRAGEQRHREQPVVGLCLQERAGHQRLDAQRNRLCRQ